jgi:hypothetical protein
MKKTCAALGLAAFLFVCSSFATDKELTGAWRWLYVIHPESGEHIDIGTITMGMASAVHTDLKADGTYIERKARARDGREAAQPGIWKTESGGTVLSMKSGDTWTSMKIISLQQDTLTVGMGGAMQLVMVREAL